MTARNTHTSAHAGNFTCCRAPTRPKNKSGSAARAQRNKRWFCEPTQPVVKICLPTVLSAAAWYPFRTWFLFHTPSSLDRCEEVREDALFFLYYFFFAVWYGTKSRGTLCHNSIVTGDDNFMWSVLWYSVVYCKLESKAMFEKLHRHIIFDIMRESGSRNNCNWHIFPLKKMMISRL